jgi:hypothetical protein
VLRPAHSENRRVFAASTASEQSYGRTGPSLHFSERKGTPIRQLAVVYSNALLLAFLRARYLPLPWAAPWLLKGARLLTLVEGFVYASPLLQIYRDIFQPPRLYNAEELAWEHSSFVDVGGLKVHILHKPWPGGIPSRVVHCHHGFGASSLSFAPVLVNVSRALAASVSAHDAPGFGLTAEPLEAEDVKFSFSYNGFIGRRVAESHGAPSSATQVLVGHSMGSISASFQGLRTATPERPTYLVLVAPAIFASPRGGRARAAPSDPRSGEAPSAAASRASRPSVRRFLGRLLLKGVRPLALAVLRFVLRWLVYSVSFWRSGLGFAWAKHNPPDHHTIFR